MTMRNERKSSDGYVRIPTAALSAVKLRHLFSEKDGSIGAPTGIPGGEAITTTGITEWVGTWRNETVSVGWDWGVVDAIVVLLNQKEIRTNIQLVNKDESPVPPAIAQIHLFHWIESMSWREVAVNDLLRP
jgi:Domain of unknown function (DUF4902)